MITPVCSLLASSGAKTGGRFALSSSAHHLRLERLFMSHSVSDSTGSCQVLSGFWSSQGRS